MTLGEFGNIINSVSQRKVCGNKMRNDTLVRTEGMKLLLEGLGKVDAERFISLIIKEPFDYTKWQRDLFDGINVRELSKDAMNFAAEH